MSSIRNKIARLCSSAVVWYWFFNGLRMASGIIVLPLLLRMLPKDDLGMYYVFMSISALIPVFDFGFSAGIGRFVTYAMGGAKELKPFGLATGELKGDGKPNYTLLGELMCATRKLYGYLAMVAFVFIGAWGSYLVGLKAHESSSLTITWAAWVVTFLGLIFEIYAGWWSIFLYYGDKVLTHTQIGVLAFGIRLLLSCILLVLGGGLLSVPIAGLVGSLIYRGLTRRACLRLICAPAKQQDRQHGSLLRIAWPNSWRLGVLSLANYFRTNANMAICATVLGLAVTAEYGLSVQLLQIAVSMASVWTTVKWPAVGRMRAQEDFVGLRKLLWARYWLQMLTFAVLGGGAILFGPTLLRFISSEKMLLPTSWMILVGLNAFLEMQFAFWTTLISTENKLPFLWHTVATNALSLILSLVLVHYTTLGVGGLVLGPLLAGSLFNYWYWSVEGAKRIGTRFLEFLLAGRSWSSLPHKS